MVRSRDYHQLVARLRNVPWFGAGGASINTIYNAVVSTLQVVGLFLVGSTSSPELSVNPNTHATTIGTSASTIWLQGDTVIGNSSSGLATQFVTGINQSVSSSINNIYGVLNLFNSLYTRALTVGSSLSTSFFTVYGATQFNQGTISLFSAPLVTDTASSFTLNGVTNANNTVNLFKPLIMTYTYSSMPSFVGPQQIGWYTQVALSANVSIGATSASSPTVVLSYTLPSTQAGRFRVHSQMGVFLIGAGPYYVYMAVGQTASGNSPWNTGGCVNTLTANNAGGLSLHVMSIHDIQGFYPSSATVYIYAWCNTAGSVIGAAANGTSGTFPTTTITIERIA